MSVHLTPDTQAKLDELANMTGLAQDELLQDAVAGLFDELQQTRTMLDSRYDDLASGRVQPIDGDEAYARLRARSEMKRAYRA